MNIKTSLFLVLLFGLISCNQADKKETTLSTSTDNFIKPPVNGVDVPYKEYSVDAEKGDTVFYKTGSIILFPPNSFVDKEGNVIQGNVQVKYREFSTPIDFYLSGIPMDYDSVGKLYAFESSGMCEILAYKDGVPVFVNPKSKPEINLTSDNISPDHNVYYLNTVQKKWILEGTSIVTELDRPKNQSQSPAIAASTELTEPLKPEKANNKSPVIRIIIDPSSFKELLVYDNLQFQLDVNEKNFNHKDTIDEWNNVELVKGKSKDLYTIKFSNAKRTVSYSARPVLEGKDYNEALIIFKQKQEEYNRLKKTRVAQEIKDKGKYTIDSLRYMKPSVQNKKLNRLIESRNRVIKEQNEVVSEINKSSNNFRTFAIDRFGYWNCDVPVLQNLIPITVTFVDKKGKVSLTNIAVFCKSFNSILRYRDNNIGVVRNLDNMIIGVVNGEFAYISYEDYEKLGINQNTTQQTFFITVVSAKENNYENIKAISGR